MYLTGNWVLSSDQHGWGLKVATRFHLAPRLRKSAAIILLPLYALAARAGTALTISELLVNCATVISCIFP